MRETQNRGREVTRNVDGTAGTTAKDIVDEETSASPPQKSSDSVTPKLDGLCVNCSQRFDCTYEQPIGGVWHCEDYC